MANVVPRALLTRRLNHWLLFDFICKLDARDDFGQLVESSYPPPRFLGTLLQLKHHVQPAVTGETPLRAGCLVANRPKG